MRRIIMLTALIVLLGTTLSVWALTGLGETTVTELFDESDVATAIDWGSESTLRFGVAGKTGDEVAAAPSGDIYFLVLGESSSSVEPSALVCDDGSDFTNLLEYEWNMVTTLGEKMRSVLVSPVTAGDLTAGQPVILRWQGELVGEDIVYSVDLVKVDSSGNDTVLVSFGTEASGATAVIDGDGTMYVGPMSDGSIVKVSYSGSSYVKTTVPTDHDAGATLLVDADGYLYTFASGVVGYYANGTDRVIYRIDPDYGTVTEFASIDGWTFFFDLTWSGGKLWAGCRQANVKGKKLPKRFVAEVTAENVADVDDAITDSTTDPVSLAAAGDGKILVLEGLGGTSDASVYEVTPGAGGGGGKPPKKPKK